MILTDYIPRHAATWLGANRNPTLPVPWSRQMRHAAHRPSKQRVDSACRGKHCAGNTGTDLAITEARAYYRNGGK